MKRWYSLGRVCGCGTPVSDKSQSGLCRACFNRRMTRDPAIAAKKSATLRKRLEDPENYARHVAQSRRAGATKRANPEIMAKYAAVMREKIQPLSMTPENLAKRDYALTGRRSSEAKLKWLPPEWRDEYRYLTNTKRLHKAEAREIIFASIRAEREKEAAKKRSEALSPFERQERALQRGARLIANDLTPNLAAPVDYGEEKWRRAG